MAEVYLQRLSPACQSWLLLNEDEPPVVSFSHLDDAVTFADVEVVKGPVKVMKWDVNDFAIRPMFVKERMWDDTVCGRACIDVPMAKFLGMGNANEQKFVLELVEDVPILTLSSYYDDNKVIFSRLCFKLWWFNADHVLVNRNSLNTPLNSARLRSNGAPGLTPTEGNMGLLSSVLVNKKAGLWEYFISRLKLRSFVVYGRSVHAFAYDNGQRRLMFQRHSEARLEIGSSIETKNQLRFEYMRRQMESIRWFLSNKMSPADLAVAPNDREMLNMNDSLLDPVKRFGWPKQESSQVVASEPSSLSSAATLQIEAAKPKDTTCHSCGASFKRKYERDRHVKSVHRREKLHSCKICSTAFFQLSHLNSHMASVHENIRKSKCAHCGKLFTSKYKVRRHIASIHPENSEEV